MNCFPITYNSSKIISPPASIAGNEVGGKWLHSNQKPESTQFPPHDSPEQHRRGPAAGDVVSQHTSAVDYLKAEWA